MQKFLGLKERLRQYKSIVLYLFVLNDFFLNYVVIVLQVQVNWLDYIKEVKVKVCIFFVVYLVWFYVVYLVNGDDKFVGFM